MVFLQSIMGTSPLEEAHSTGLARVWIDRPHGILSLFTITSECVCVTKPCGVYLEKAKKKMKNVNPMETTWSAEKNRTTNNMWVEKKGGKNKKRGKYSEQKGAL